LNPSCPATVFNVDGIPDWEVPLLLADSWIARRCNPSGSLLLVTETRL
jgi:hypothetical protein